MTLKSFFASGTASIRAITKRAGAIADFAVSITVSTTVCHSVDVISGVASESILVKFIFTPFRFIYLLCMRKSNSKESQLQLLLSS